VTDDEINHPGLLNLKILALVNLRKFEGVKELIQKSKEISVNHDPYNYLFVNALELIFLFVTQEIKNMNEKLEAFEELFLDLINNNENNISEFDLQKPYLFGRAVEVSLRRRLGDLEKGITVGNILIQKARHSGNRFLLNKLLNNTALCYIESGNLKKGLEYLEEAFSFSKIIGNKRRLSTAANNIGFIYRTRGEIEKALEYFQIAHKYAKECNLPVYIFASQINIAHILVDFNEFEEALLEANKAMDFLDDTETSIPTQLIVSLHLCRADIYEKLDNIEEASNILNFALMESKKEGLDKEILKIQLRQALYSVKDYNLGQAEDLLNDILVVAVGKGFFESIVNAKLQMAQIDLFKYRITNDKLLLQNSIEKIDDIKKLCLEQDYKLVLIDIYLLSGLLLSLQNKQPKAIDNLQEAIKIAKEKSLDQKEKEARKQLEDVKGQQKNLWERISKKMTTSIHSTVSFESVVRPKTIDTMLKAFLAITTDSGVPIYQYNFTEDSKFQGELLSGLLSAIQTMAQTILKSQEGGLKLIDHGDVSLMFELKDNFVFVLILNQETFMAREKLRIFIDKYGYTFNNFVKKGVVIRDNDADIKIDNLIEETFSPITQAN
jgi:tetratricopeptide (TPR) repeat protein